MIEDLKVKTILVSQPEPKSGTSPYHELGKSQKVNVDFRSFIHLEPVAASDVRQQKVSFTDHTAVILTSRHAADHYFRICQEMRFEVPTSMKYFCMSEAIAFYLQKYIFSIPKLVDKQHFTHHRALESALCRLLPPESGSKWKTILRT